MIYEICKHTNSETQIHYFQPTSFTKLYTCHISRVICTYMLPTLTDKQKVSWHVHLQQFPIHNSLYHGKIKILKYEFWYKLADLNDIKIPNHHSELKFHYLSRGYRELIFSTFDSYGTSTLHLNYVEIKCQLDATDVIYCRLYCMLNMFRAILCPSSGARGYYTDGRCLWYLVLKVMCPVCRLQIGAEGYVSCLQAANRTHNLQHQIPQAATIRIILSSSWWWA